MRRTIAFVFVIAFVVLSHVAVASRLQQVAITENAVVLEENTEIVVLDPGHAVKTATKVVKVFNAKGAAQADFVTIYNDFVRIGSMEATIQNEEGKVVKKFKKKDFRDISAVSSFSIYEDNRAIYLEPRFGTYPYTVHYTYEIKYKGLLNFPAWYPQSDANVKVLEAGFKLSVPEQVGFNYSLSNIPDSLVHVHYANGIDHISIKLSNIVPKAKESFAPPAYLRTPKVNIAMKNFEMDGYAGQMASWSSFGEWIQQLNQGKDEISYPLKVALKTLTADLDGPREVTRAVYEYMQGRTRYVSIQMGIGGWQPFSASSVEQYGYGDCKALSIFMQAMLTEVGVKSYYTLVNAGSSAPPLNTDIVSPQFNHAFLCVPMEKDTVWLECTSQQNPFGYLGTFTSNRPVLVINEKGGEIVRTPRYTAQDNRLQRKADISLKESGEAEIVSQTLYTGLQPELMGISTSMLSAEVERRKWFLNQISSSSIVLHQVAMQRSQQDESIQEDASFSVAKFARTGGARLVFNPNIFNKSDYAPDAAKEARTQPIFITRSYYDLDSISVAFPEKLFAEFLPERVSIKSAFGSYQRSFVVESGKVCYIRSLTIEEGEYDKDSYPELVEFYRQIKKHDQEKIVLRNNT